jgi:hypothetical protein
MRTDGIWFKDETDRTLLLRGINLSGSSKLPVQPNGATYRRDGFFEHREVSFVGRPFPLDEADEHFRRLRAVVRPYARKTAGTPQQMRWDLTTRIFEFTWQPDPSITAPTEIVVPPLQYPHGYRIELSTGTYRQEPERFRLLIETPHASELVTLRLQPA